MPKQKQDAYEEYNKLHRQLSYDVHTGAQTFAQGRMKIKLLAAAAAIDGGVKRVVIADARLDNCISRALQGEGTSITA